MNIYSLWKLLWQRKSFKLAGVANLGKLAVMVVKNFSEISFHTQTYNLESSMNQIYQKVRLLLQDYYKMFRTFKDLHFTVLPNIRQSLSKY